MNNLVYSPYPPQYNNTIKYQQGLPPPPNQIPQNHKYFQGMMPYMNLQMMGNTLEDQNNFPMPEYYYDEQGNMLISRDYYLDNNNSEINRIQNESPAKSTNEDSKLLQKETNFKQNKTQDNNINNNINKDNYINLYIILLTVYLKQEKLQWNI